jgi:hypothetical protein
MKPAASIAHCKESMRRTKKIEALKHTVDQLTTARQLPLKSSRYGGEGKAAAAYHWRFCCLNCRYVRARPVEEICIGVKLIHF